jgi:beta-carotene 3-hydroxylase
MSGFILYNIWLVLITIISMEFVSWILHKYLFHGPLWFIHRTHHARTIHSSFELNDIFSFAFASVAIVLIYIGWFTPSPLHLAIGFGITLYGFIYFLVHDGLIHQRYPFSTKTSNVYLKQIQRAHQRHHIHSNKSPSEEFGLFFIIGRKYWRDMFIT